MISAMTDLLRENHHHETHEEHEEKNQEMSRSHLRELRILRGFNPQWIDRLIMPIKG